MSEPELDDPFARGLLDDEEDEDEDEDPDRFHDGFYDE